LLRPGACNSNKRKEKLVGFFESLLVYSDRLIAHDDAREESLLHEFNKE
jgi:hypothetical protein